MNLFKWHKDIMCRYADAAVRAGGHARPALYEWLSLYGVTEDEYPLDSAYKSWQRWNVTIRKNNTVFFGQLRSKPGVQVAEKLSTKKHLHWSIPDIAVELAASRFVDLASAVLPQVPKKLKLQVTCYLYEHMQELSHRQIGAKLGISHSKAGYACRAIRNWADADSYLAELLRHSVAYEKK